MAAELARQMRALRDRTPLSLRELESRIHVSDSSLSRYLAGRALPPWKVVEVLGRLGGGDLPALRGLWEQARVERRRSRATGDTLRGSGPDAPDAVSTAAADGDVGAATAEPGAAPPDGRSRPLPRLGVAWFAVLAGTTVIALVSVAVSISAHLHRERARTPPVTSEAPLTEDDDRVLIANDGPRGSVYDSRAVGIKDGSFLDGARAGVWRWRTDDVTADQMLIWIAESRGTHKGLPRWRLRNVSSERCLDRGGGHDGAEVFQWNCSDSPSQLWYFDDGRLRSELDQRCLDVRNAAWDDGTPVQVTDCGPSWSRRWRVTSERSMP